jgi:uncharacterized protein (DUF1697 family)
MLGKCEMIPLAAFIRAIGPETHKVMPQADLCAKCETLGLKDVRSFIASGNLYFRSGKPEDQCSRIVEKAIRNFGLERTIEDLDKIITDNPFPNATVSGAGTLSVSLFDTEFTADQAAPIRAYKGPEHISIFPRLIYVQYTEGQARSKISHPIIERKLRQLGTARNMNTIIRIRNLLGALK